VFTSTVMVSGNGDYDSASYVPTGPGPYRWVAVYSGDARNLSAGPTQCGEDAEVGSVAPADHQACGSGALHDGGRVRAPTAGSRGTQAILPTPGPGLRRAAPPARRRWRTRLRGPVPIPGHTRRHPCSR
jgi:hypothetical protein